jgi:hypothetical protein
MKLVYTILAFLCIAINSFGQYSDPNFPKPTSGYGSDGSHTIGIISFANPYYPAKNIEIYYPSDITTKVPTIFYSHAFGGNNSANIIGMLNFVAMKGYAIVFVPYQTTGVTIYDRYDNLLNGFRKAARDYPAIIDTTKVGFLGHSFGGGAVFAIAYKCFTQNNWGQSGRFIYALAQWYSYNISQTELQSFPANTKLLTEVFDDDVTNDHRMAIDIYNNINISPTEKDFILVKSDTIAGYIYLADHGLPNTSEAFDALDYYAYYRLLDALCDYTFNGNLAGKDVALGNGSANQVTMPTGLKSLVQTDNPLVVYPESKYTFPCSSTQNLRSSYCPTVSGVEETTFSKNSLLLFPNPASKSVTVILPKQNSINELKFYNSLGQLMLSKQTLNQTSLSIDLSSFTKGIYLITLGELTTKFLIE